MPAKQKPITARKFRSAWDNRYEEAQLSAMRDKAMQVLPGYMHSLVETMNEQQLQVEMEIAKGQRTKRGVRIIPDGLEPSEAEPLQHRAPDGQRSEHVQISEQPSSRPWMLESIKEELPSLEHIGISYDYQHPNFKEQAHLAINKAPGKWVDTICYYQGKNIPVQETSTLVPVKITITYAETYESKVRERNAFYRRQTCRD